jgi:hypothetical protein
MPARGRREGWLLGAVRLSGWWALCGALWGALLLQPALPARCAEPREPHLQGTWLLNPDLTARLSKDAQEGEEPAGSGKSDQHRPGLGGVGPTGSTGQDALDVGAWSPSRERHDAEARREVVASLDSLTIVQQGGQVTITDQAGHARVLKTDGSKVRDQGGAGPVQLRASWDRDGSLVVEVKPDKGTRRTESYVVSNDGKHLYLTVTIAGQRGEVLRAYDRAPAPAAP